MLRMLAVVLSVVVLGLLWYCRTWFHGPLLFFYATPVIWQALLVTLALHYGLLKRIPWLSRPRRIELGTGPSDQLGDVAPTLVVTPVLFLILLGVGGFFAHHARGVHLAEQLTYLERDSLPESAEAIRLMPYQVALRYAKDSLQLSQYKLGTENIALVNGELFWTFPLVPDGLVITFLRQNKGIVTINATTEEKNAAHTWEDMVIGEGMQIRDNLYWNLFRERFFISTDDPYYTVHEGQIFAVVGAVRYRFHFRWGVVYTAPEFAGVFVIDTDGRIEWVTPDEALTHPVLAANRIFPEGLARTFVDAHQYHLGLVNRLFIHEDQIDIQDVRTPASSVNRQPYLMPTEEGLKWFISAEPYGASHGVFKIFLVDAKTGEIEVYSLPQDQTLTGPVRAVDYVRRSNPIVDWSRFDSVEPLPFVRNQELYWKLTVIPQDAAGIAYQAFVNAQTNQVAEVRGEEEINAFLAGRRPSDPAEMVDPTAPDAVIRQIQERLQEIDQLLQQLETSP